MAQSRVEYQRAYFERNKERLKAYHKEIRLKRRYGLTQATYDELLQKQNGGCAICGSPPNGRALQVDHDHRCCPPVTTLANANRYESLSCGKCIRGLLCWDCNSALGKFKEDPVVLQRALDYIGK